MVTENVNMTEPCQHCAAAPPGGATLDDAVRAYRLLHALVDGQDSAVARIGVEYNECLGCVTRAAGIYIGTVTAVLIAAKGDVEGARKFIEESLLDGMDGPDDCAEPR